MAKYLKKFDNHAAYEAAESGLILPNVSLCVQENDVHYNPYFDPCASEIVKTTYEWVEIGGVKWATKNVGALSVTDYGQKFQWGDISGYTHDQISGTCKSKTFDLVNYKYSDNGTTAMTKYNSTDGKTVLEASDDAATVNMGSGWRMPTKDEYVALGNAVNTAWTNDYKSTGVKGLICTAKDSSGAELFFPAAGYCVNGNVYLASNAIIGHYWSSSLYIECYNGNCRYSGGYGLEFNNSLGIGVKWNSDFSRHFGCAVRGILDE